MRIPEPATFIASQQPRERNCQDINGNRNTIDHDVWNIAWVPNLNQTTRVIGIFLGSKGCRHNIDHITRLVPNGRKW